MPSPGMVIGYCEVENDNYKANPSGEYPTSFYKVPNVGDRIQGYFSKCWEVIRITHSMNFSDNVKKFDLGYDKILMINPGQAYIILTLRNL